MTPADFVIILGIIFVAVLLLMLILLPTTQKSSQKKRKAQPQEISPPDTHLQEAVARMQKHIQSLHGQIAALQQQEKAREHELTLEKVKVKKLQEKLSQERDWHEKEQKTSGKKGQEFYYMKDELSKLQDQFGKEHAENLRQKKEIEELKHEAARLQDVRRAAESESAQLKAKMENCQQEIAQLRKENSELRKKKEDTMWVAKSDHDKLQQLLREKEKELERLKRESNK